MEDDIYSFSLKKIEEMSIETIPHSLYETLEYLKQDDLIRKTLGKITFQKYIKAKTQEWNEYSEHISQWELDEYLEKY